MNLNGRKMHVVHTAPNGVVGRGTIFGFSQAGNVVTGHYSGGSIRIGYLVGLLTDDTLAFRYCQISGTDQIDGGSSTGRIEACGGGRLRIVESFAWESREGCGQNIFEEIADDSPHPSTDREC
jgi:hypothetical protein